MYCLRLGHFDRGAVDMANMFDSLLAGFGYQGRPPFARAVEDMAAGYRQPRTNANTDIDFNTRPATEHGRDHAAPPVPAPVKQAAPRTCTICCEGDGHLIKACRICAADYCTDCLEEMFTASLDDSTRFPPRCCTFMQLYTVLDRLSTDAAEKYRRKFEEWMTPDKVYCPVPSCSAFIPARYLPAEPEKPKPVPSLQDMLSDLLSKLEPSENARFFAHEMPVHTSPAYRTLVSRPMYLQTIRAKLIEGKYASAAQLTEDVELIASNASLVNGERHPVTTAAEGLRREYYQLLAQSVDDLTKHVPFSEQKIFACNTCHIALCSKCKQIDHGDAPCDLTKDDEEVAMLAAFGYKRCPKCKHGVRRMFGCSHMQCHCGAHWCWWCVRSLDECMGDCGGPDDDEDMDEDEDDEDDEDEEDDEDGDSAMADTVPRPGEVPVVDAARPAVRTLPDQNGDPNPASPIRPVNLDAGGARRWAETGLDFGDEPEDGHGVQVWSCAHHWRIFKVPEDEFDHGNLDLMECNRCCAAVKAPRRKKRPKLSEDDRSRQAWECLACRLIVCPGCKDSYRGSEVESQ